MCRPDDFPPYDPPAVHFRKLDAYWAFDVPSTGATYGAYHNAGFAGRDWELWRSESSAIADGRYSFRWVLVKDMLPSRRACVEAAIESERFLADLIAETYTPDGKLRLVL